MFCTDILSDHNFFFNELAGIIGEYIDHTGAMCLFLVRKGPVVNCRTGRILYVNTVRLDELSNKKKFRFGINKLKSNVYLTLFF